jgi:hypothetical protein
VNDTVGHKTALSTIKCCSKFLLAVEQSPNHQIPLNGHYFSITKYGN